MEAPGLSFCQRWQTRWHGGCGALQYPLPNPIMPCSLQFLGSSFKHDLRSSFDQQCPASRISAGPLRQGRFSTVADADLPAKNPGLLRPHASVPSVWAPRHSNSSIAPETRSKTQACHLHTHRESVVVGVCLALSRTGLTCPSPWNCSNAHATPPSTSSSLKLCLHWREVSTPTEQRSAPNLPNGIHGLLVHDLQSPSCDML